MPELALLRFLLYRKVFEFTNLILQLNNKPDFGTGAKVANNEKADDLKEAVSAEAFLVEADDAQLLLLDRSYLHYVSDVQVLNPLSLVEESKDVPEVHLGFRPF